MSYRVLFRNRRGDLGIMASSTGKADDTAAHDPCLAAGISSLHLHWPSGSEQAYAWVTYALSGAKGSIDTPVPNESNPQDCNRIIDSLLVYEICTS